MNKIKIQVMCSVCKRPSDSDKGMCWDCMTAIYPSELKYQVEMEPLMAHAKHVIRLAHEMCKYDSLLLKD